MQFIILSAFIIMLASLIGVIFAWKGFSKFLKKNRQYLTTFAIGVFTMVAYSLVKESFHLAKSPSLAVVSILGGMFLLYLVSLFMPPHHHDTDDCCHEEHNPLNARRILFGDAIHNIGDGVLLVSAFLIDINVGLIAAFGILLHELVQEIAEFFILKEAGYTTRKALIYNFLISGTIFIGIAFGLFVSSVPVANVVFIGLAAGGFIYILTADLIPYTIHSIKNSGKKNAHIFIGILGILAMFSVRFLAPHTHEHDHEDQHLDESIIHDEAHDAHEEHHEHEEDEEHHEHEEN